MNNKETKFNLLDDIGTTLWNIFIVGVLIIFLIPFIASLSRGKFDWTALLVGAYWVGFGLVGKYLVNISKQRVRLKIYKYILIYLYLMSVFLLTLSYPFNIIVGIIYSILYIFGIRTQFKLWAKDSVVQ